MRGGSRWRRLGVLAGLMIVISYDLATVDISVEAWSRAVSVPRPSASGAVFAAGMRGDRATAESSYQSHCASCHGRSGKGDGWRAWIFRLRMRDLSDRGYVETLPDDYLFQIIKQGGASLGKPGMPSWGQELTDEEISDVVVYIRSLATSRPPDQPAGTTR